jgi:hypothetical protein
MLDCNPVCSLGGPLEKEKPFDGSAHRKPMGSPNGVGDDFTWMTKAIQARHCARYVHAPSYNQLSRAEHLGNANLSFKQSPLV